MRLNRRGAYELVRLKRWIPQIGSANSGAARFGLFLTRTLKNVSVDSIVIALDQTNFCPLQPYLNRAHMPH